MKNNNDTTNELSIAAITTDGVHYFQVGKVLIVTRAQSILGKMYYTYTAKLTPTGNGVSIISNLSTGESPENGYDAAKLVLADYEDYTWSLNRINISISTEYLDKYGCE